jgi:hypothetical protein
LGFASECAFTVDAECEEQRRLRLRRILRAALLPI